MNEKKIVPGSLRWFFTTRQLKVSDLAMTEREFYAQSPDRQRWCLGLPRNANPPPPSWAKRPAPPSAQLPPPA